VDGTQIDATTVDIRADQTTFVEFQQLTTPDRARLFLNIAGLSNGLTMSKNITVVTSACVELVVVQTKNGSGYVTNVTVTPRVYLTTRNITLLSGTTLGTAVCVVDPACCAPQPPLWTGCAYQFPASVFVTMSLPLGTCGCFTGTFTLTWDPFTAGGQYRGTFSGCAGVATVTLTPITFVGGAPTLWQVVWTSPTHTYDSSTVSQDFAFVCSAIASGSLNQIITSVPCAGSFTFTVTE